MRDLFLPPRLQFTVVQQYNMRDLQVSSSTTCIAHTSDLGKINAFLPSDGQKWGMQSVCLSLFQNEKLLWDIQKTVLRSGATWSEAKSEQRKQNHRAAWNQKTTPLVGNNEERDADRRLTLAQLFALLSDEHETTHTSINDWSLCQSPFTYSHKIGYFCSAYSLVPFSLNTTEITVHRLAFSGEVAWIAQK